MLIRKIIILEGGYDAGFTTRSNTETVIEGGIYVNDGKVIINKVKVR